MAKTKIHGEYLDPSVISGQTQVTAVGADSMLIFDATDNALKKALLSDLIETVGSTPTFSSVAVDNITIDGTEIDLSSGSLTLDVASETIIDSGSSGILRLKHAATDYGMFFHDSNHMYMQSNISDGDIIFRGKDGGSTIAALTLDMSDSGKATFNAGATLADYLIVSDGTINNYFGTDGNGGLVGTSTNHYLRFITNNVERVRFLSNGNSGFGITNPVSKVHIQGPSASTYTGSGPSDVLRVSSSSAGAWIASDFDGMFGYMGLDDSTTAKFAAYNYATSTEGNMILGQNRVYIKNNGYVGIGTQNPQQMLEVNGEIIALSANITDSAGNTSIGYGALHNLTSGDSNVALGYEALEDVNSGIHNVGLGYRAGMNITTGNYNVAVGNYALSTNTTGGWNTCVGYGAGNTMSGNDHNTCVGRNAGYNITSGGSNTIIGSQAGDAITSAHNNTFVGTRAGTSATTGNGYNTAIGVDALEDCTTGSFNVSLGTNTIKNVTSGTNNIGIGYRAGNAGQPGGALTTHSNRVCLGDTAITNFDCQVSLSAASDERDKTDFSELDLGLDFVKNLKPYTFRWDKRSNYVDWDKNPDTDLLEITHDGTHKEDQLDIGFKAQDVEKLEKAAGYNRTNKTNLTYNLSGDGKQYSMKYEKLVPILVKAIQELEAKVEELENR